jgi:hypothetical protein
MLYLRKLVHFLCATLLRFLVYATATATVFLLIGGNSEHIKQAIDVSGAYKRFVPSIIESNQDTKVTSSIPLGDPEVVRIINEAFPPQDLKNKSSSIIDSVFAWLMGSTPNPTFSVDFTQNKNQLGDKLSEYAFTKLAFKDVCKVQPAEFDPFKSECRPAGFDIFQGQKDFAGQIKASSGFLGNTVLTDHNLPKNKTGKNIFEQYSYAPKMYAWLRRAPLILGGLTILASICYIWTDTNKRKGVMRLGRGVIGNSVTLIATPLIFGFIAPWVSRNYTNEIAGSSSEVLLNDIVTSISKEFDRYTIWFGAILLLAGLSIVIAEKMTRAKARYSGIEKSGLSSSNEAKKKPILPRGKLGPDSLPLQSSEVSLTKKAKLLKKNSKYRKVPL